MKAMSKGDICHEIEHLWELWDSKLYDDTFLFMHAQRILAKIHDQLMMEIAEEE